MLALPFTSYVIWKIKALLLLVFTSAKWRRYYLLPMVVGRTKVIMKEPGLGAWSLTR